MTTTIEKRIETLIHREIYLNQYALVEDLILKPNPDMIECIENFYDESSATIEEYLQYETDIPETDWQELDVHERLNLAQAEGFEAQPQEIFEWWLVSDWLASKLKEFEEPVLDCDYGTWWGRTCTGQAISMDWIIRRIVEVTEYAK
ncbi:hypothetical protein [Lewinella sp. LCG006]|uniref:hypothetical protein n=1 Tax=Lewinella sp. LCG006 TaxID=3231911 RepID=UPI0034612139